MEQLDQVGPFLREMETGRGLDKVDFGEAMLSVVAPGCAHVRGNVGDVRFRLRVFDPWVDPKASHYAVGEVRGVAQCIEGSRAGDHGRIVTRRCGSREVSYKVARKSGEVRYGVTRDVSTGTGYQ